MALPDDDDDDGVQLGQREELRRRPSLPHLRRVPLGVTGCLETFLWPKCFLQSRPRTSN